MKDPHTNIAYDFEGDDDDAEEYGQWRRSQHPVEEYPLLDGEDVMDDSRKLWLEWLARGK